MQDEHEQQPEISVDDIDNAPRGVPASGTDVPVSIEDLSAALSRVSDEKAALEQELEETRKKVRTTEILDDLIEPYAKKAYRFMCAYSSFVGLYLLLYGFGCFKKEVAPSVMEFLVGSTAVTVIGLVGMVLTGIFVGARKNGS
ncbi:hypothetical protein AB838_19125 [Rhodobacteraceae bacterium (ex Bugula neritina AB1)]|nr:hypothetical protein AB838_19125 [Rhodobacteraceae bacterium (ex Bugula neritina AB1)]